MNTINWSMLTLLHATLLYSRNAACSKAEKKSPFVYLVILTSIMLKEYQMLTFTC